MTYIGIDPDIDKSGVAWLDSETRELRMMTFGFADLIDLFDVVSKSDTPPTVVVEASWLVQSNWHYTPYDTRRKCASLGRAVGRNHQTGILIAQMAEHYGLRVTLRKPLTKCWQGKDRKITQAELEAITGTAGRTNQEMRDAALLAWVEAGLPIRVKPKKE